MAIERKRLNCAVYTRKSSEEGLDQEFNSLDAQREACEAYIQSQKHEGWRLLKDRYDDGGISGGTIDRPGLLQLLDDVEAGKVQIVVVYKVDRLTRSLADFAKIIEIFDHRGASFVSVTQQFNTTSSMGRLTLNVLLSFAQFEREVTGERIRDKIAASKKKGMWMGGNLPLGYDTEDRKLVIVDEEAETVRHIFRRYAALGCVRRLKADLDADGIVSKSRTSKNGRPTGGKPFARGALYHLLRNRLYLGEITHKGQSYPGEQAAIVDKALWDEVQSILEINRVDRKLGANAKSPSLLTGLLFDEHDRRLTPSHANKSGRRYRYYICVPNDAAAPIRLPAKEVENAVLTQVQRRLSRSGEVPADGQCIDFLRTRVSKIVLGSTELEIHLGDSDPAEPQVLTAPFMLRRRGVETKLVLESEIQFRPAALDPAMIKAVAKAHSWNRQLMAGEVDTIRALARRENVTERYVRKLLPLALLSPNIVRGVLEGRQPSHISLETLVNSELPRAWSEQAVKFGF